MSTRVLALFVAALWAGAALGQDSPEAIGGPVSPGLEREVAGSKSFRGNTLPRRGRPESRRWPELCRQHDGGRQSLAPNSGSPSAGLGGTCYSNRRCTFRKKTALFASAQRAICATYFQCKAMGSPFTRVDDPPQALLPVGK